MKALLFLMTLLLVGCDREKRTPVTSLAVPSPSVQTDAFIIQDQAALKEIEAQFGLSPDTVAAKLAELQKPLEKFDLAFPENGYNVISLPETPSYRIIKRTYLGLTPLGSPFFLEVRAYPGARLDEVRDWYMKLLTSRSDFLKIAQKKYPTYLGRGDRNRSQYDPSHGFSVEDRGIFVSFIEDDNVLYVLYADAPYETFKKHKEALVDVIP